MTYALKPEAIQQLDAYIAEVKKINGASGSERAFTVNPTVAQNIELKTQESSHFLSLINIVRVDEQAGEKIGIGVNQPIAYRTTGMREPVDPTVLDSSGYVCRKTDFDTHITYQHLDQWAKSPNFQQLIRDAILGQIARNRIMIGWNGTSAADTTNRTVNPRLQDVNIGWIQKLRLAAPGRVMSEAIHGTGKVRIGLTGDYVDLDALVFDLLNNIIDPWHRNAFEALGFVAVMSRDLNADRLFPLVQTVNPPSELMAADVIIRSGKAGGLPVIQVPYFPPNSLLITPLKNLSIYWQNGTRRRRIVDNPARDRIEDYQSVNEAYVIEDMGQCAFVENIQFV
ncbi:phage capsid protein [Zoogloea oryzae]|uniref:Phage capsid protein n=1 Tax=Zoogloea oryzae TaxID=310767 RepID=A0ABQ6FB00_9RHOO|nr:phage major capsid protein, P2 family [Zoogloea oryzae]GLT22743.1 phage capsid protein [Zoogloea oryzae]